VSWLKFLHVGALAVWCAGLIYLPVLLAAHRDVEGRGEFIRVRRATRLAFLVLLAPAAVLAVASGTALLFRADALHGWMFLKLACVGALIGAQLGLGAVLNRLAATDERPPRWLLPLSVPVLLGAMGSILWLVLAEPEVADDWLPGELARPGGLQDWVSRVTPI
jgi:uncharacterized membrane protein